MDLLLLTAVDPFSYQIMPDLGLMYVAAAAREAGLSVDIKASRKEKRDHDDVARHVSASALLVIGMKCFSNEKGRVCADDPEPENLTVDRSTSSPPGRPIHAPVGRPAFLPAALAAVIVPPPDQELEPSVSRAPGHYQGLCVNWGFRT